MFIVLSCVASTGYPQQKMEDRTKVKLIGIGRHKKIGEGYLLNKSENSIRLFNPSSKRQVEYPIEDIGSIYWNKYDPKSRLKKSRNRLIGIASGLLISKIAYSTDPLKLNHSEPVLAQHQPGSSCFSGWIGGYSCIPTYGYSEIKTVTVDNRFWYGILGPLTGLIISEIVNGIIYQYPISLQIMGSQGNWMEVKDQISLFKVGIPLN